jgi:hypothetical protein
MIQFAKTAALMILSVLAFTAVLLISMVGLWAKF